MKVLVKKASLKPILRWAQGILFGGAILLLGYCVFVVTDAWLFQRRASQALGRLGTELPASPPSVPTAASGLPLPPVIGPDGLIGRIDIQRLGVSVIVVEGTDRPELRRAAGHITGTALPGRPGNVGIAAHRDTFFRPLRNIQRGDVITFTTLRGEYRYRVVSTKITDPYDIAVLNPSDASELLTLVTCYPFYFVGSAPNRFIVRAERVL
jgi:sortase A